MDNGLVTHLRGYISAMFEDIAWLYSKPAERERDKSRLLFELGVHGPRVLTMDLPAICKHLDRCLDEGSFTPVVMPYMALGAHGYPKLFGMLWKRIFVDDGKLGSSPDLGAISAFRTLLISCKKLRLTCTDRRVYEELQKFFKIEQELRSPSLSWDDDEISFSEQRPHFGDANRMADTSPSLFGSCGSDALRPGVLDALQQVCDRVSVQFGDLHDEDPTELPKHGPGVVANLSRADSKYRFSEWPAKLAAIFPPDLYAYTDFCMGAGTDRKGLHLLSRYETPSRLITVPKTLKAPRLIAAEPSQHQWVQQLVRNQLETRLENTYLRSVVRFRSQERNRDFAREGSRTSAIASVDLSSASDRLSCWTVERAFRANRTLVERLHACRTRWLSNRIDSRLPEFIRLKKFAPMGSSVTFPVQSIIYACVAITAVCQSNGWAIGKRSIEKAAPLVSVFGDDILLPTTALDELVKILTYLGLKVNNDKTYGTGKFRESCGIDCFDGSDVTPVYLLNAEASIPLAKAHSQIATVNNFWRQGWWNVSNFLAGTINHVGSLPVVGPRHTAIGLISFSGLDLQRLQRRWNDKIQVEEVKGAKVHTKVPLLATDGDSRLFQWFIEKPQPDTRWVSGTKGSPVVTLRPGWLSLPDMLTQLTT